MENKNILYNIKSLEKMVLRLVMRDSFKKIDMPSPTQFQIMDYIMRHKDENVYQKDLEKVLNLRRATVSGVLQTMEKNHLIKREVHDGDARVKKILLDENVNKMFLEHKSKFFEIENYATKGISENDLILFNKVIDQMKNNLIEYNNTKI